MLDHVSLGVSDIERSRKFYDQALAPLGIERLYAEGETASGYGAGKPIAPLDRNDFESNRHTLS